MKTKSPCPINSERKTLNNIFTEDSIWCDEYICICQNDHAHIKRNPQALLTANEINGTIIYCVLCAVYMCIKSVCMGTVSSLTSYLGSCTLPGTVWSDITVPLHAFTSYTNQDLAGIITKWLNVLPSSPGVGIK